MPFSICPHVLDEVFACSYQRTQGILYVNRYARAEAHRVRRRRRLSNALKRCLSYSRLCHLFFSLPLTTSSPVILVLFRYLFDHAGDWIGLAGS
jgi:hypothetical protein